MLLLHNLFCLLLLFSALMAAFSLSPVESVLFLILCFCLSGSLLFMYGADFLGLVYIIVYVGAVAVLFLFIIMMLNMKNAESFHKIFFIIGLGVFCFFYLLISNKSSFLLVLDDNFEKDEFLIDSFSNIDIFGQVLYNYYANYFLIAGVILLVALIGCIVITLDFNRKVSKSLK